MNVYVKIKGGKEWKLFAKCPTERDAKDTAYTWAALCTGTQFAVGTSTDAITAVDLLEPL